MSTDDRDLPEDQFPESAPVADIFDVSESSSMEERFASLEQSNVALASDVRALTATLQIVNELQVEQRAQARRQMELDEAVAQTRHETDLRLRRTRRAVNVATLSVALLLPLVSIIVYLVLLDHVNDLLDRNSADRVAACQARNEGTMANVKRERLLASIANEEREARIHSQSADEIEKSLIDCGSVYGNK